MFNLLPEVLSHIEGFKNFVVGLGRNATGFCSRFFFLSSGEGVESFEDLLLAFRLTGIEKKNKDCFTEVDGAR